MCFVIFTVLNSFPKGARARSSSSHCKRTGTKRERKCVWRQTDRQPCLSSWPGEMKFAHCAFWPQGPWAGETRRGRWQERVSALSRAESCPGGSLQAPVSYQICGDGEEWLPPRVRTEVNAETGKSRQPLSPKIKSRRASLVLNKTWRRWTLSTYTMKESWRAE